MSKRCKDMYECFHCGNTSVVWDMDFDFQDLGIEGDGIIHFCHCTECGAQIQYRVPMRNEPENEEE